jgi:hypothetical protein
VVWCVLTNGLVYRVYKSNEPVGMERKLLFEVDLREATEDGRRADVVRSLRMLSRDAVGAGELDAWGEAVFTDVRVRAALAKLGADPSPDFLSAVTEALEGPSIESDRLRGSLGRILGQHLAASGSVPLVGVVPTPKPKSTTGRGAVGTPRPPGRVTYSLEHHTAKKPSAIVDWTCEEAYSDSVPTGGPTASDSGRVGKVPDSVAAVVAPLGLEGCSRNGPSAKSGAL